MNSKKSIGITDIILAVAGIAYLVLIFTVFTVCGPKEDGSFMVCQWAWRAVVSHVIVIAVLSLIHLFVKSSDIKLGLAIAVAPVSIIAAIIPGYVIKLCMMKEMKCHGAFEAGNRVFGIITAAIAVWDIAVRLISAKKEK